MLRFFNTENLKSKKEIDELYHTGVKLRESCINLIYKEVPNQKSAFKVAFVVPKKLFKKAVDRNLLKRRMKGAYRANKHQAIQNLNGKKYQLLFIYNDGDKKRYEQINISVVNLLNQLV